MTIMPMRFLDRRVFYINNTVHLTIPSVVMAYLLILISLISPNYMGIMVVGGLSPWGERIWRDHIAKKHMVITWSFDHIPWSLHGRVGKMGKKKKGLLSLLNC